MKTLHGIYKQQQQENQNIEKNGEKQQYGKKQSKSVNTMRMIQKCQYYSIC